MRENIILYDTSVYNILNEINQNKKDWFKCNKAPLIKG